MGHATFAVRLRQRIAPSRPEPTAMLVGPRARGPFRDALKARGARTFPGRDAHAAQAILLHVVVDAVLVDFDFDRDGALAIAAATRDRAPVAVLVAISEREGGAPIAAQAGFDLLVSAQWGPDVEEAISALVFP